MQVKASAEALARQSRTNATSWHSQGQWPWWPPHWPIWRPTSAPPTPGAYVPQPLEPAPPLADDIPIKLMTFNVYYAQLGASERLDGISSAISQMQADIAVITEQWHEKPQILERVREKSGRNYAFCDGGNFHEETWDGDIMYDADKRSHLFGHGLCRRCRPPALRSHRLGRVFEFCLALFTVRAALALRRLSPSVGLAS